MTVGELGLGWRTDFFWKSAGKKGWLKTKQDWEQWNKYQKFYTQVPVSSSPPRTKKLNKISHSLRSSSKSILKTLQVNETDSILDILFFALREWVLGTATFKFTWPYQKMKYTFKSIHLCQETCRHNDPILSDDSNDISRLSISHL